MMAIQSQDLGYQGGCQEYLRLYKSYAWNISLYFH